jgi:outer membrane protein assembly factor BamB
LKRLPLLALAALSLAECAGHRLAPRPPLFPLTPAWKTPLSDFILSPLAADSRRVYVATRDGAVQALDQTSGAALWKVDGISGRLTAGDGTLLVRGTEGTVWSLQPRNGGLRWKSDTGVPGELPAVLDGERALVAGRGLVALDLAGGKALWTQAAPTDVTSPPVVTGARLLVGEADGTLRCRDRATGVSLWTYRTKGPLFAPPLVDEPRRRLYLGTTDRRILELSLDRGRPGWRWSVGADIRSPGLLTPDRVLYASFDAVIYCLHRGGNLAWRAPLPSRPLSGPLLVEGYVLVACFENELVGFAPDTGARAGSLRVVISEPQGTAGSEIRTPPIVSGKSIFIGLRDRSVVSYALPAPTVSEPPGTESPGTTETIPKVDPSPPSR